MSDLIERLEAECYPAQYSGWLELCKDAAQSLRDKDDEIARLRAEIRRLKCPHSHELADWCECGWSKIAEDK